MVKKEIKFGYEVESGKEINIKSAHLVVTGITQESGKTTALLALIKRGKFKAVIFRTKIGERALIEGTIVPPYYKSEFDWEYAAELLEASRKEKLKFERSWIIKYSKTARDLLEFKANIDNALVSGKLRELEKSVLITLQAYLEKILPELQYAPLSNTLDLQDGVNIMDLERFKEETQGLIIRSVLTEVLKHHKNTIVVCPEAWRYLPERLGSPVKRPAEAFIRQGATNNNYLWIDSQDITGISKTILKQVSTWCMGYQREINEIKRTLDQIPLPKRQKPDPADIASLRVGQFFVATSEFTKKCYMQPAWVDDETARAIALGKKRVEDLEQPQALSQYAILPPRQEAPPTGVPVDLAPIRRELTELRNDFFNKIQDVTAHVNKISSDVFNLKTRERGIDIDEVVGRVLQKMPTPTAINKEGIVNEVLARVPKVAGATTYEVAPIEKIQKDFLEEAKSKILEDVKILSDDEKRVLKYIETQNIGVKANELITKCFFLKPGGSSSVKVSKITAQLKSLELLRKDSGGRSYPHLKERIKQLLEVHNATEQEIEQVHNHILVEML